MENLGADIFGRKDTVTDTTTATKPASPMGSPAKIKVVGVGGGGGNAIERMINAGLEDVEFWVMNTDLQVLKKSSAKNKLQLGSKLTNGLGAGNDPLVGEKAAEEAQQEITAALDGADMVFVTAGMGGGTGTGAAPVVARIAKDLGILTVAVVTKPFGFEGKRRMAQATQGLEKLKDAVDSLLVIPNDKLFEVVDSKKTICLDAFVVVDEVLLRGVKGISDIITKPGLINVDFADIKSVMLDSGSAVMGIGYADGEGRALEAAKIAINSKLLETSIQGASGVVVNMSGPDLTLLELADAINLIEESVLDDAKLIMGYTTDASNKSGITITIVATGFELKPSAPTIAPNAVDKISPSIDEIFSGLNTSNPTAGASDNFTPSAPSMQSFTTNIEIPDFLKK